MIKIFLALSLLATPAAAEAPAFNASDAISVCRNMLAGNNDALALVDPVNLPVIGNVCTGYFAGIQDYIALREYAEQKRNSI